MLHPAYRRAIASALIVSLSACTTVRAVPQPKEFITAREPNIVWLTRSAPVSATIAVEGPRILGDTLSGFVNGRYTEVPFAQISQVRARQHSRGKTIGLVAALGLAVFGLTFVITGGGGSGEEYEEEGIRPRR